MERAMRFALGWSGRGVACAALVLSFAVGPRMVLAQAGGQAGAQQDDAGPGRGGFAGGQMVRGTVTGFSGTTLSLKTDVGEQYQVVTTTNTRIMKDRQTVKLADIAVGSGIGAMGLVDAPAKTIHAMALMVIDPEQMKRAREAMGKSYIAGKVLKIEDTSLTILRSDGFTQKIEVDESTSFKRGGPGMRMAMGGRGGFGGDGAGGNGAGGNGVGAGAPARTGPPAESITLMEIKVGDTVMGQGGLKNGVFVPKELAVMPPGAGRQGRRGGDGLGSGAPGTAAPVPPQ